MKQIIIEGHEIVVKLLIEHGADVNITNLIRDTPLMLAARKGENQIASQSLIDISEFLKNIVSKSRSWSNIK